ncbi:MAG: alpha/beta fold hydrolase [Candidatus Dormibacteria bacterium]
MEPVERRVDVGQVTLSTRERNGGRPALLALHGLASNARWWDLVGERLAPRYRVIAADLRGHGLSDRPATGYDTETVAADVRALCDRLDIGEFVVAGHSWGAAVALTLAAAELQRCRGCVCVDGGVGDLRSFFGSSWEEAQVRMRPPAMSGITEALLRAWVGSGPLAEGSDADTAAEILRGNFEDAGDGTIRPRLDVGRHMEIAKHLYHFDSDAALLLTTCPVLLASAGDPQAPPPDRRPAVDHALHVLGERGRVAWIAGHHDLPVQRPGEVAAAIGDFINATTMEG